MTTHKVSVKWNKEKFNDVEVNVEDPPLVFKAQLFALSGVQPERQKIMSKGKTLGNDNWDGFDIKDGAQLMMIGSSESVPEAPLVKPVFLEDMTEGQLARAMAVPAGLKNLGNTCYMNATLQCLKTVPELTQALKAYRGDMQTDAVSPAEMLTAATRDLFQIMDKSRQPDVMPIILLNVLHMAYPHFGEKDSHGHFQQQDANELWVELMRQYQTKLTATTPNATSVISQYFGGHFDVNYACKEAPDEPPTSSTEDFLQLSCFLSQEVKYLHSGLKSKMVEEVEKSSPSLGRDAKYEKKSSISRLPAYLTIQIIRFFYKEKDKINAKILKDVKFPMTLDVYDLCTPELQKKLSPMRDVMKAQDDKKLEAVKKAKIDGVQPMDVDSAGKMEKLPFSFPDDPGSNNSGMYELQAVLTHKGRSSNSGHYVAWVKRSADDWLMCDDDVVGHVNDEEILKLSGGGDWHCAYVLLYGPKRADGAASAPSLEGDVGGSSK